MNPRSDSEDLAYHAWLRPTDAGDWWLTITIRAVLDRRHRREDALPRGHPAGGE